jgi:hypothetical protein
VNQFDRHLVSFVLTWAPFGGPTDEDTFPRFGLRANRVMGRFRRIVAAAEAKSDTLDPSDADLVTQARQYLTVNANSR